MRTLVALTLPEANQVIEALTNRRQSMRHRVEIGLARDVDVAAEIAACHAAEVALREAFDFDDVETRERWDAEWAEVWRTGSYDADSGEAHDPLPDVPVALVDRGDHHVFPMGVGR